MLSLWAAQESYRENIQHWFPILNLWEVVKWSFFKLNIHWVMFFFPGTLHSTLYTVYIHIWRQLRPQSYLMSTEQPSSVSAQIYPSSPGIESGVTRYPSCLALLTFKTNVTLQRQTRTIRRKAMSLIHVWKQTKEMHQSSDMGTPTSLLHINTSMKQLHTN